MRNYAHAMPFGAEITDDGTVRFRLWAPAAGKVDLHLRLPGGEKKKIGLDKSGEGWFFLLTNEAGPGTLYQFRIDDGPLVPDPASRHQPLGVHGPSEVVEPAAFPWRDDGWRGRPWEETVVYELHVGTFTREGTFGAVEKKLDYLAGLGITAVQFMPLADFPGERDWGYNGVQLFAPARCYGRPDDLKRLIQSAHDRNLMVFLDVVYNHFGPEGNYLYLYGQPFFTDRHHTPWGDAINFDGPSSRTVRDFFIHNTLFWLEEYRFDGLRFDAVHAIFDDSTPHILEEIAETVHGKLAHDRFVHLILENDKNEARFLARADNNTPRYFTAQWNDDAHHACHVILTGENAGYYVDYAENPVARLGRCLTEGYAYQGDPSRFRGGARRGTSCRHLPPCAFVSFLQNHDQIGNRAFGERLTTLADENKLLAFTALLLLAPSPPLLFMGEEFGCASPFLFFCHFSPDLATSVTEGRRREFASFPAFEDPLVRESIPDPNAPETMKKSILSWEEADSPSGMKRLDFYRRLLHLRQREIVPRLKTMPGGAGSWQMRSDAVLSARWLLDDGALLSVWMHLGNGAHQAPDSPGSLLFETPDGAHARSLEGEPLPWSICWFLENRKQR